MNYQLRNILALILILFLGIRCNTQENQSVPAKETLIDEIASMHSIKGREKYLSSPSVTAGDRVYSVGHQDGSFPDLGWHVEGEMGGIWSHPIKLLDGFTTQISVDSKKVCLEKADRFISYPIGNVREYSVPALGIEIKRVEFVPDNTEGMIVEFVFENKTSADINANFSFNGFTDLSPVWLSEKLDWKNGDDQLTYHEEEGTILGKDANNEWYVMWGASTKPLSFQDEVTCNYQRKGNGAEASLTYDLAINAGERSLLQFYIAGSHNSKTDVQLTYKQLLDYPESMIREKKERYENIANTAKLTIPDKDVEQAFEWIKYNTDWLIRDVPEVGRGLSAGLPDYPWWFGCDNTYSLQGVLATGRPGLAKSTLQLIHELSVETNDNGRIIHEASTNGVVFNPGNINETPHFAYTLWEYYRWTGDRQLLQEYYPTVKKGMDWLLKEQDEDGNLCPEGVGMMEIHGLDSEMIDVAVYTQQGFEAAAKMAQLFGEVDLKEQYTLVAQRLKEQINTKWWVNESNSYADFISTKEKAIELIEGAIIRADTLDKPWAVQELEETKKQIEEMSSSETQGFVVHHNWVVNTPLEMGIADPDKALKALETASKFVNPFGMFVTGIDRDESAGADEGSFAENQKTFSYIGAVMTLPTGVQAISESNYGRPDKALAYLKRMTKSFSYAFPGGMYEVSPDFGMMVQAWNIYAMGKPIVSNFFGVKPEAWREYVFMEPNMPSTWDTASLENLVISDNSISINKSLKDGNQVYEIKQSQSRWHIDFMYPYSESLIIKLNGKEQQLTPENGKVILDFDGELNTIEAIN